MENDTIPLIKLEIQHMKQSIVTHMGLAASELGGEIEKQIDKAVESYDYHGQITKIVHNAITSHVENFFKWGDGQKAVSEAVKSALEDVLNTSLTGSTK